ncbi:MAG: hypothetical protein IPK26_29805, partial [Planctomycetes bacterium]|nr:hypothetical protein [Planctomycetota bacterium]
MILYDALDRPIRMTEPPNRVTQLRHDDPACGCSSSGNLTGVRPPNNATLGYVYDGLGRKPREIDQTCPRST